VLHPTVNAPGDAPAPPTPAALAQTPVDSSGNTPVDTPGGEPVPSTLAVYVPTPFLPSVGFPSFLPVLCQGLVELLHAAVYSTPLAVSTPMLAHGLPLLLRPGPLHSSARPRLASEAPARSAFAVEPRPTTLVHWVFSFDVHTPFAFGIAPRPTTFVDARVLYTFGITSQYTTLVDTHARYTFAVTPRPTTLVHWASLSINVCMCSAFAVAPRPTTFIDTRAHYAFGAVPRPSTFVDTHALYTFGTAPQPTTLSCHASFIAARPQYAYAVGILPKGHPPWPAMLVRWTLLFTQRTPTTSILLHSVVL
jgi:hypothetical protein